MAAFGHSFSVFANASVRPPINPKTRFASTLVDRTNENVAPMTAAVGNDSANNSLTFAGSKTDNLPSDSTDLSELTKTGDSFYEKLQQLKESHRKTLTMYEQLYKDKQKSGTDDGLSRITRSRLASLENLLSSDIHSDEKMTSDYRESLQDSMAKDNVRDLSFGKPPSGHPRISEGTPTRSSVHSVTKLEPGGRTSRRRASLNGGIFDDDMSGEVDNQGKENHIKASSLSHNDTKLSAMARIGEMWERFSVDNYYPRSSGMQGRMGVARSNSMSRLSLQSLDRRRLSTTDRRTTRESVTVPKSFTMLQREANRTPRKSKAAIELEQREEERRYAEELECQKKFKAIPIPAHVHLRLFDELNEKRESRRRFVLQHKHELLNSIQKPFQFTIRDEERRKIKSASEASMRQARERTQFRAHPVPKKCLDDSAIEKLIEEEEYRKIRMKMRAKELLRSSSLPPTMKRRGLYYTDGRERQKLYSERAKKAGITTEHKFHPRINRSVPDLNTQYENFMRNFAVAKHYQREATVCKPFNLRTSTGRMNSATKTSRSSSDGYWDECDSVDQSRMMSKSHGGLTISSRSSTGAFSLSSDVIPSKTNTTAQVRSSANKMRIQKKLEEQEAERRKVELKIREADKRLKKTINERTPQISRNTVNKEIMEKLKSRQIEDQRRVKNYQQQLNEMKNRLSQRPLLFEQAAQKNARKAAERKYDEALSKSGLDVEFLSRQSASCGGSEAANEFEGNTPASSRRSSVLRASSSHHSVRSQSPVDHQSQNERSPVAASGGEYTDDCDNDSGSNASEEIADDDNVEEEFEEES